MVEKIIDAKIDIPIKFSAVMVWPDGGSTVVEYFDTQHAAVEWIEAQPKSNNYVWHVGEWE